MSPRNPSLFVILADMGASREPRVSGAVMLDQMRVMEEMAGPEALAASLATLPAEHRSDFEHIMPVSWIDSRASNDLIAAVARQLGRAPEEFQVEVVRVGVERTLSTLWRIILRFTSDAALVKRTPLLYSKTYDVGELVSRIDRPGRAALELRGWPSPRVPNMDLIGLSTGIETVLRCAGRGDAVVQWDTQPHGAVFAAEWSP